MKILEALNRSSPTLSFEFFPPKDERGVDALVDVARNLAAFDPAYVSVTYGAGGSTRERTLDVVDRVRRATGVETMPHLTCVGSTEGEVASMLDEISRRGLRNVLALRGDRRDDERADSEFTYATDLVRFVRARTDLGIAAACYPETHPEAESAEADLDRLAEKVAAGVDFLVTQLFFEVDDYVRFVARARERGITCPIVPGVMPVANLAQIERITRMCGASIPESLRERLDAVADDADAVVAVGIEHAIAQCRGLLAAGAPGLHLYCLNRVDPAATILRDVL